MKARFWFIQVKNVYVITKITTHYTIIFCLN